MKYLEVFKIRLSLILVMLALIGWSSNSFAQWQYSGSNIYYNSGNVGIGTTSPANNLHLLTTINGGGATLETSMDNVYLSLSNTGTNGNYWRLASTSGTSSLGGSTGNFAISKNGMDAQFVINNSGNVGIGTTSPANNLHLLTTINGGGATLETSMANVYLSLNNTGTNGNYWRLASTSGTSSLGGSTGNFAISKNGINAHFVINNSGFVGIGTVSPDAKLEVADGDILVSNYNNGLILTSPNGTKYKVSVDNSGTLTTEIITKISTNESDNNIKVYPNPVENILTIDLDEYKNQNISVELFDVTGKMVLFKSFNTAKVIVDLNDFITGTYILKIKDKEGNILHSEKVVKK